MAYGLQIFNANGRTMIDSTDTAPNTQLLSVTATAANAQSYPPSGFTTGDLVLARPTSTSTTQFVGRYNAWPATNSANEVFANSANMYSYNTYYSSGITTALVRTQATVTATPSSGEYGMDIYAANGSVIFSATRSAGVKILSAGTIPASSILTYTIPSGLSYNRIFAVCNSTYLRVIPSFSYPFAGSSPRYEMRQMYEFIPGSSQIKMHNTYRIGYSYLGAGQANYNATFPYMIVYNPN
jgi:hypothetical protein|tara:strand:- start:954 stop:1673 length:720 start_codon:yes stop_codon:yes gene_type:complete